MRIQFQALERCGRLQNRLLKIGSMAFAPLVLAALVGVVDLYGSSTLAQDDQAASAGTAPKKAGEQTKSDDSGDATSSGSSSSAVELSKAVEQPGAAIVNTTSASLSQALDKVPARKIKFTLNTRQEFNRNDVNDDKTTSTAWSFVALGYALTPTKQVQVRQEFLYTRPKTGEDGKHVVRDLFIGFNDTNFAKFWGDGSVTSISRLYLPTGEESRYVTKQQGQLLQWFIANKPFGKFEFDYHLLGVYFNQSQNTYMHPTKKVITANFDYDIETWLSAKYNITSWLSVFQTAGMDSIWRRPMDGPGVQRMQAMEMETGVTILPNKNITVIASLYNYANIFDSPNPFSIYRDDETIYRLILSATM